jgi:hypothetical protein
MGTDILFSLTAALYIGKLLHDVNGPIIKPALAKAQSEQVTFRKSLRSIVIKISEVAVQKSF